MTSSEIKESGKFSGHKSNFSQTCNRLSQYLREKGSFGELSLGLSPNLRQHGASSSSSSTASPTTMNLLPMIDQAGRDKGDPTRDATRVEPEGAQMTIFYGGQVIVFNDFPADKAKEIMDMAASSKAGSQKTSESAANGVPGPWNAQRPAQPLANGLPIMRNASLGRFLEKRKDRITARAPYRVHNTRDESKTNTIGATSGGDESKAWLGLAAQPSQQQNERQL